MHKVIYLYLLIILLFFIISEFTIEQNNFAYVKFVDDMYANVNYFGLNIKVPKEDYENGELVFIYYNTTSSTYQIHGVIHK